MVGRRWLPQFSLRNFLIAWMLLGGAVAWVSHAYYRYQAEQVVLERIATQSTLGAGTTITRVRGDQKTTTPIALFL